MTAESHPHIEASSVRRVGVVAKTHRPEAVAAVGDIVDWLSARGVETVIERETAERVGYAGPTLPGHELPGGSDLLVALGGDGTLLRVARDVADADRDVPILAVNCGSLGFLTEITLPELYAALESILDGTAGCDERHMLRAGVHRGGHLHTERVVLNDVVIGKAALSNILELAVTVGEQFMTNVRADGFDCGQPDRVDRL